jgi:hypothetical protein
MPRAEEAAGGQSVGDVSFDERIGVPQRPVPDAIAAELELEPEPESRCEPAAETPAVATAVPEAPIAAVEPSVSPELAVQEPASERDPPGGTAAFLPALPNTAVPALPNTAVPALPNTAVPAGLDDAVSASASLLGSVAGGFGLAAVAGGGLVIIGLGAALGAWYSVALANSYLGRR